MRNLTNQDMKALFIGGTGTISSAITRQLAAQGCELYLLNRVIAALEQSKRAIGA